jgi:DNA-binding CsgD family transcriptional regulator
MAGCGETHEEDGAMPADLSLDDVSAVIRLVREVCDRWDDPREWREHLLHGACALLGGNVGTMVADAASKDDRFVRPSVVAIVGVPAPMRALAHATMSKFERRPFEDAAQNLLPGLDVLYARMLRQGWVTAARGEISDDATYHAAPHYLDFRRHIDCDDYVVSIRVVDVPRRPEAISIDRPHGAPRFGPREVMLLKLLHDEIGPLIGTRLATEEHLCRDGLSKRLRETLSLLLEGRSEKEAAAALGLGARTVHDYVTTLYEHFRVSSRAELLAYFIRRAPVARRPSASGRP